MASVQRLSEAGSFFVGFMGLVVKPWGCLAAARSRGRISPTTPIFYHDDMAITTEDKE